MTLRLRLVLALVALVTVAQGTFFAGTYTLYRNSEYQRLDAQLRSSEPVVDSQLDQEAGLGSESSIAQSGADGDAASQYGAAPVVVPPGTFAELVDARGRRITSFSAQSGTAVPKLPAIGPVGPAGHLSTVGSTSGSGSFRVLAATSHGGTDITVIAIPTTEVTGALDRLLLIEAAAIAVLLIILSAGSWLILRRGLRPLERIAGTARMISGGDLSQRVSPSGGGTEVGQLGLALNTMLGDIEAAFAEREASEERLRQFLADVSHELRTPLTSIQGFAELFRVSGGDSRVDLPTILRRIEEESGRMRLLVEDLLLLARLDQTRPPARLPVDLALLAADACSDAIATDPRRPITLDAPRPVVVAGDQAHLRQAVANLVTNALRHTPPGTPIDVAAAVADGHAVISVRDRGQGLDAETAAHAFDRFWQADKARAGTGFGLGLSIVAGVAHEHDGTVTSGNAPGGGAVFTIRLPTRPAEDPGPPQVRPEAAGRLPERASH